MIGPNGPRFRVVEDVLTPEEVADRPSREEVERLWQSIRRTPLPRYEELRRLVIRGRS